MGYVHVDSRIPTLAGVSCSHRKKLNKDIRREASSWNNGSVEPSAFVINRMAVRQDAKYPASPPRHAALGDVCRGFHLDSHRQRHVRPGRQRRIATLVAHTGRDGGFSFGPGLD